MYNLDDLNEHKYVLVRLTSAASQLTHGFSYTPAKVRVRDRDKVRITARIRVRVRVRGRVRVSVT